MFKNENRVIVRGEALTEHEYDRRDGLSLRKGLSLEIELNLEMDLSRELDLNSGDGFEPVETKRLWEIGPSESLYL